MVDLLSLLPNELQELMSSLGEPKYRATQIFEQLHKGILPENMTNIGKITLAHLHEATTWYLPTPKRKLISQIDGTVKYLWELSDGYGVESVVMRYEHGLTICISSQVGCRMGCKFCASTIGGKVRDLTAGELLGQIIAAEKDLKERISNIVMMGIGEPLDNYDQVIRFLHLVNQEKGLNIGYRHISLSTCGVVPRIYELAKENLPLTLSISLHAATNEKRDAIMPVNHKWSIEELLTACADYYRGVGRRISFEYTLIAGQNDSKKDAVALGQLLNHYLRPDRHATISVPIHVNLIPVNTVKERNFSASSGNAVKEFAHTLEQMAIRATIRRTLGPDINASCGQLRRDTEHIKESDANVESMFDGGSLL